MRTITIQAGSEYRTSFINIYEQDEFLYPEYCQTARCIDEIVCASAQYDEIAEAFKHRGESMNYSFKSDDNAFTATMDQQIRGYPNNIIAFCAKRGQGKTSCMLSVSKALSLLPVQDWNKYCRPEKVIDFWKKAHKRRGTSGLDDDKNLVSKKHFYVIDPIDPSAMEHGDSLLRTLFLRMEMEVRKYLEQRRDENSDKLRKLRDQFGDTYRKLIALKDPDPRRNKEYYDDLTQLEQSGDSVILRRSIMELIKSFLDYMGYDILVIQIDDADLNSKRAFEITEDIRNYCVGPHVIVLMALHLGTLRNCIEQENIKRYEYLLRTDYSVTHMEDDKCREMAERYIDKLIPGRHQIHIPYLKDFIRDGKSDVSLRYELSAFAQHKTQSCEICSADELQAKLFDLIYRKTGVILMPQEDYYHNFLPRRFRELTHMLSFFSDLDDVTELEEDSKLQEILVCYGCKKKLTVEQENYLDIRINNLKQLELYLRQHWATMALNKQQWRVLDSVADVPDSILCKKAMDQMKSYLQAILHIPTFPTEKYPGFVATHPSFADARQTMKTIDWELDFENKYEMTFSFRFLFTIRLNQIAMEQLRYGGSLEKLGRICEYELFYEDPLNMGKQSKEEYVSVSLLNAMFPRFDNMNRDWADFYEPLSSPVPHGALLNSPILIPSGETQYQFEKKRIQYQIDKNVKWLRLSFNRALFCAISDIVLKNQKKTEYEAGTKDVYNGVSSLLKLICNYDMQHRLVKYVSKDTENDNNKYRSYKEAIIHIEESMNKVFSSKECVAVPKQELTLSCNYSGALLWYNSGKVTDSFDYKDEISVALEIANPQICLDRLTILLEELTQKLQSILDGANGEDVFGIFMLDHKYELECMSKLSALQHIIAKIVNECIVTMDVKTINHNMNWVGIVLRQLDQKKKEAIKTDLNNLADLLHNSSWLTSQYHEKPRKAKSNRS